MRPILLSGAVNAARGSGDRQLNRPPGQYPGKPAESSAPAVRSANRQILTPGERSVVTAEAAGADGRGARLAIAIEDFNAAAGR